MSLLLKLLAYAAGLAVASWLLGDMFFNGPENGRAELEAKVLPLLGVALILTIVNAIVRPLVKVFTFPLILVTLGLFMLVINAWMLLLTDAISDEFDLGFHITGFFAAIIASVIITIASWSVDIALGDG